ncbi:MAG: hypothetical protein E6G02_13330 [Actinobacteria bacterium]|nr:MAG: hypothetical protein E6G02_13330 [Actinomycetota bacterium]
MTRLPASRRKKPQLRPTARSSRRPVEAVTDMLACSTGSPSAPRSCTGSRPVCRRQPASSLRRRLDGSLTCGNWRPSEQAQAIEAQARRVAIAHAASTQTTAPVPSSAPPAPPATGGTTMTVTATAYTLQGHTATGAPVGYGVVAVDPSVIPLGTRMTIPGYGEGVAADTGGAIQGAVIDLWFPTAAGAASWGRRTVTITLH